MIKTSNDNWVAGRLCNSREIYIVLNQKLTKLYDVDCEYICTSAYCTIYIIHICVIHLIDVFKFNVYALFLFQLKFKIFVRKNLEQYFFMIDLFFTNCELITSN